MEVLTAFIREKSKFNESLSIILDEKEKHFVNIDSYKIPQDIQAAITVIGRRNIENDPENDERIDLTGANLNSVRFVEVKLDKCRFYGTKLNKAVFSFCHFDKVNLDCSELDEAQFSNRSKLVEASLSEASLIKADLPGADLTDADLTDAVLTKANLTLAELKGADLTGADLSHTDIEDADFTNSDEYQTKITVEQILKAKNWDKAKYNPDFWEQLQPYLTTQNE